MPLSKITAASISDGTVVAADIANGAVTGPKLGLTSINANNIVNATITGAKLAANTITGDVIGQNAVSSNNIATDAVTQITRGNTNVSISSLGGNVTITTANSEKVRIDTNGNISAGLTSGSSSRLTMYNGSGYGHFNWGNSPEDGTTPLIGAFNSANIAAANFGWGIYDSNSTGNLSIYRRSDSTTGIKALEITRGTGDLKFDSGYGSAATAYGCRAWVTFNGSDTPTIRASGNVSSITDFGIGDYRINFTTNMVDTNYTIVGSSIKAGGAPSGDNSAVVIMGESPSVSGAGVGILTVNGGALDRGYVYAAVFR